jgi:endonuclease I
MRISIITTSILFLISTMHLEAQGFQVVFPGLSGNDLIDSLGSHFRPDTVLDYANARDTLYAKILTKNDDSLRCVYSGHTLYLDPSEDPTQYIFQGGGSNGMNTEHVYPQAKGATSGTNAHSDMHHLYPTRIAVNEARGDKPFAEIPDPQTQKWFINNQVFTSIPTQTIERYSESAANSFEPRESVKGDIARSVFYFYTVYRSQANDADPNFFALQRGTLCQWTYQDPVDAFELEKTWLIAKYQDGKPNPFVLDCTLAKRSWCPEVSQSCLLATEQPEQAPTLELKVFPNPGSGQFTLAFQLPFAASLKTRVLNTLGQEMSAATMIEQPAGQVQIPFDVSALQESTPMALFLEVQVFGKATFVREIIPFQLIK